MTKDHFRDTIQINMNTVSISQLKTHPAGAIAQAVDYPVAVEKRSQIKAYLIGKELFEKIVSLIENCLDNATVKNTNFNKGKDFERVARELGI